MIKMLLFCKFARKAIRGYIRKPTRDFVLDKAHGGSIHILGNGPSLSKSIGRIEESDDVMMVNYAILTDLFFELKPRYLCLADPSFFEDSGVDVEERKKVEILEIAGRVDWPLEVIVPYYAIGRNLPMINKNISFKYMNTIPIDFSIKSFL